MAASKSYNEGMSYGQYVFGLTCIFVTAWAASAVGVLTNFLKEIHFSVMMFHYGWSASATLLCYIVWEYTSSDMTEFRLFSYSLKMYVIVLLSAFFNAVGMNMATIAL